MSNKTNPQFPYLVASEWGNASSSLYSMGPVDLVWLALIVAAKGRNFTPDESPSLVAKLSGRSWSPTCDVVEICLKEMLASHALTLESDSGLISAGPRAADVLTRLMKIDIGSPLSPLGRVGVRLQMAGLDFLPDQARMDCLDRLLCAYEAESTKRNKEMSGLPLGNFGRRWRRCEDELLAAEHEFISELRRTGGRLWRPRPSASLVREAAE
jgi:hypothetical protein